MRWFRKCVSLAHLLFLVVAEYKRVLWHPPKNKSSGLRSDDLEFRETGPESPTEGLGCWSSRKCCTSLQRWRGALSCSKCTKTCGMSSLSCGHNQFCSIFRQPASVMVLSAKKNGPYTFCSDNAQNKFTFGEAHADRKNPLDFLGPKCYSYAYFPCQKHEHSLRH